MVCIILLHYCIVEPLVTLEIKILCSQWLQIDAFYFQGHLAQIVHHISKPKLYLGSKQAGYQLSKDTACIQISQYYGHTVNSILLVTAGKYNITSFRIQGIIWFNIKAKCNFMIPFGGFKVNVINKLRFLLWFKLHTIGRTECSMWYKYCSCLISPGTCMAFAFTNFCGAYNRSECLSKFSPCFSFFSQYNMCLVFSYYLLNHCYVFFPLGVYTFHFTLCL